MQKVFLLLLISIQFVYSVSSAQNDVPISLQEALDAARSNNKEIAIARLEEESANARFGQTNAVFMPQVSVSYSALETNNPLNVFGFKLQQEAVTSGDFNPELLNNPQPAQNFMAKAQWQQPILNLDMLRQRKAARQQIEVYAFKTKRTAEYLTFEVKKAYAYLQLAHQSRRALETSLETVKGIYAATQNRFEKGLLQKADLLQVQVQVSTARRQLAEAISAVQNASDQLSLLMEKPLGVVYAVDAVVLEDTLAFVQKSIPENRVDFLAIQSAADGQDMMMRSGRLSYLPRLNAFGEYMINDRKAFGFGSDSYLVGAQLTWSLFNGMTTRGKIAEHRAERNKLTQQLQYQKEQSQVELEKTIRQWEDSRFALRQHEISVGHAEEALRILRNRYEQGLVTTNDVLQSQSVLSQQRLSQAQVFFEVNTTLAYLQFLTTTSEK